MTQKIFRELLPVEEARKRLLSHFKPTTTGVEPVPLANAYGRILAASIEAPLDVPPFDRVSMDGFAVQAEDTFGADEAKPVKLKVAGRVGCGEKPTFTVSKGEVAEASTGAPIPTGANAVVMVEYTTREEDSVKVYKAVSPGENIMAAGSDIMMGELILRRGTLLTPREVGVVASLGIATVPCFKKPRVAVISTGDELVSPGEKLEYGKVYDINGYALSSLITECGCEPNFLGVVKDDPSLIRLKLQEGLKVGDVVITSGSTSAGVGDLLYRVIDELGKPGILVHGIAVKPGKPTIIAVVNGKPLFGLPGYPTSALTIFDIFVRPVLLEMAGLKLKLLRKVLEARVREKIFTAPGRRDFIPVNVVQAGESEEHTAYPILTGSGAITTLAEADGFIEIPESRAFLEEGEQVKIKLFSSEVKPADLMFIGSHCIGLDILLELLHETYPDLSFKVINAGSSGGLAALRRGEADVAGVHLLDEETGEYNIPFLKRHGLEDKAVLVRGYIRKQGLIFRRGNPKNILGLEDVLREDVTIVNRNPGSGTRILLDAHVRKMADRRGLEFKNLVSRVKGYRVEVKSHSAVASAVLHGKADVGLGIETVAHQHGLGFLPIAEENYDFAVKADRLEKPQLKAFLSVLRSGDFKQELEKHVRGLTPSTQTGKVIYGRSFK